MILMQKEDERGRIEAGVLQRDKQIRDKRIAGELGETEPYAAEICDFFLCKYVYSKKTKQDLFCMFNIYQCQGSCSP
jgi:hypothetical protein